MCVSQEHNQRQLHRSAVTHRQAPPNHAYGEAVPSATAHLYGAAAHQAATYPNYHHGAGGYTPTYGQVYGAADNRATYIPDTLNQGAMQLYAERAWKKQSRALNSMLTTPLAVCLHNLTQVESSDALAIERAVLLRAKKPATTTIQQIYRDPSIIVWDHPLILSCIQATFNIEITRLNMLNDEYAASTASTLTDHLGKITGRLLRDQLRIPAPALARSFASMMRKDPTLLTVRGQYEEARGPLMMDADQRLDNIYRTVGICWKYTVQDACRSDNCPLDHACLICGKHHPTVSCKHNATKWKLREVAPKKRWSGPRYRGRRNNNNNNWAETRSRGNNNERWAPDPTTAAGGNRDRFAKSTHNQPQRQ